MSSSPLGTPVAGAIIEAVKVGPITLDMLKLYAKASGDYNAIHTDEAAALQAGLPGIIAHGMLTAGFLADRAVRFYQSWGSDWKLSSFQSRFKSMTFLDDIITVSGTVKSATENSICLELSALNPAGELTTQAHVEFTRRRA
jgi:acyl dehydratase